MRYGRLNLTNFRASSRTRCLQCCHIPTGAVTVVLTTVWILDHLKYTHLEGQIIHMNTAWNRWGRNLLTGTALSLYDNRTTPIIIMDITRRHIQNPFTCTTSSAPFHHDSTITAIPTKIQTCINSINH